MPCSVDWPKHFPVQMPVLAESQAEIVRFVHHRGSVLPAMGPESNPKDLLVDSVRYEARFDE